jgi:hypothetical protein
MFIGYAIASAVFLAGSFKKVGAASLPTSHKRAWFIQYICDHSFHSVLNTTAYAIREKCNLVGTTQKV